MRIKFLILPGILVVIGWLVAVGLRFDTTFPPSYRPVTTKLLTPALSTAFFTPSSVPITAFRSSFELAFQFGLAFAYLLINVMAFSPAKTAHTGAFSFILPFRKHSIGRIEKPITCDQSRP